MEKTEICDRLNMVCKALDNISIVGIQNASNLAGCYGILNEIITALTQEVPDKNKNE